MCSGRCSQHHHRALAFLEWPAPGSGILTGGLADRTIGRERHSLGIDGRSPNSREQWNYTARSIASVGVVTPAVSKDQRCLTQQLMCHHVSYPNLCNKFSESMRGTVSPASGCVTDLHNTGPAAGAAPLSSFHNLQCHQSGMACLPGSRHCGSVSGSNGLIFFLSRISQPWAAECAH